jgi:hypothetical protein
MHNAVCGPREASSGQWVPWVGEGMAPKAMKAMKVGVRTSALKDVAKAKAKVGGKRVKFVLKRPCKAEEEDIEVEEACGVDEGEEEEEEEEEETKPSVNDYRKFWKALASAKPEIVARVNELRKMGLRSGKRDELARLAKGFATGGWDHASFTMQETLDHSKSSKKADRAVPKALMRDMCGGEAMFQEALLNGDIEEVVHPEDS